jgi:hypothetical protein
MPAYVDAFPERQRVLVSFALRMRADRAEADRADADKADGSGEREAPAS